MKNHSLLINLIVFFLVLFFFIIPPAFFPPRPVETISFPGTNLVLFLFSIFLFYFTQKKDLTLQDAKKILESQEFLEYAQSIGIHMSGNSIRIMSKDIMEYRF